MIRLSIFLFQIFLIMLVVRETYSTNCELKARINKAFREHPIVEEMKHHSHKTLDKIHSLRSTGGRRTSRDSIPQLAKNIESFLQKEVTDLHICEGSMKSDSKSKKSECECPPEYYCAEVCGEGYSLSTLISWQHFPRSTSSPSRCAVSTDETRKSVSNSTFWSLKEEEKESTKVSSTEYPITKSISQLKALHYLNIRHVNELLNFLIGHLVCNEPDDPVDFLVELLGKCIKYRDSFGEPPLLFTHSHIRSLYRAFDPFERDCINLEQYHEAMKTLGLVNNITPYNLEPPVNEEGELSEDTFVFEAERCIIENLKQMFRIPKLWEENRLLWKKKKGLKKAKLALAETEKEKHKRDDEISNKICKCFGFGRENVTCQCSTSTTMKYEPNQLYLDT